MSNPFLVKLKKTGFLEKHLNSEKLSINELENKQIELKNASIINASKLEEYKNRKASLAIDAMFGQQERTK